MAMEKRINRLVNKSFNKTLLDEPVHDKKIKFSLRGNKLKSEIVKLLPDPIKPTKATPKPIPKPRKNPPKTNPKTQSKINETGSITENITDRYLNQ